MQETARDVLTEMIDDICQYISQRTAGNPQKPDLSVMWHKLCRLSRTVYERRKKTLCFSDAGFSMIDAGRGLEHLMILIQEFPETWGELPALLAEYRAKVRQAHRSRIPERADAPCL